MTRKAYTIADDELNIQTYPLQLPMHALYASRDMYNNYPPFQRKLVWNDEFKFELIDSYVRGLPVAEIQISNRLDGELGKWVLDGQQRMTTLIQFMAAMEADKAHKPIPKDEHGRPYFYIRLTERQEYKFLNSIVKFSHLVGVDEQILSTMFLRVQNQIPLSPAEKLYATNSAANKVARAVYEHPYFSKDTGIYSGRTHRRQPFHMATYPVVIEMYRPFTEMNSTRLQVYMSGSKDNLVTSDMAYKINRRMDAVLKLFDGVASGAKSELIIQYQAIWLLEFIGVDFESTPPGALVNWYRNVEALNSRLRQAGFLNLFAQFVNAKTQREYWQKWLDEIIYATDSQLCFYDQTQALAQLQRVTGWLRHNGICQGCHDQHVKLIDVEKHIFRPSDMHSPVRQNCHTMKQLRSVPAAV